MAKFQRILVVDNRPEGQETARIDLASEYELMIQDSADLLEETVYSWRPDILLLGLALPDIRRAAEIVTANRFEYKLIIVGYTPASAEGREVAVGKICHTYCTTSPKGLLATVRFIERGYDNFKSQLTDRH